MKSFIQGTTFAAAAICLAGISQAQVNVSADITTSTTWTANNTYNLTTQIFVTNGATLTIEPGTVIASTPTANGSGALAVTRGSQIFVLGTQADPVIMTSTNDTATWVGGDPKTGTWREAANEWGNLTIMGEGFISEDATPGNVSTPNAANFADMEGFNAAFAGDPLIRYGGGDDDYDAGVIKFLSLRYGGRVVGLTNELNGLSLGALGRDTDVHHVEVMNNVDDGIEIWGGTCNFKYLSIWNIGDDGFDVDQGWRGRCQFMLNVQGYSLDASQGSGVGDNCIEIDGAETCCWQPVTTTTIYNATVIGQPAPGAGDGLTAWRDGARVQYRNCIFMDCGERVLRFDNIDGDGACGYIPYVDDQMNLVDDALCQEYTWAELWQTSAGDGMGGPNVSTVNAPDPMIVGPLADFYGAQELDGNLCEMKDSVFFRNLAADAYTEADARDVFNPANNNVQLGFDLADQPIVDITRGAPVVRGGKTMLPVVGLDFHPANDALTAVNSAPTGGFWTAAPYRGCQAPEELLWTCDWTASDAFGFTAAAGEECFPNACNGDGGDQMGCTDCPCGNEAIAGTIGGCLNSAGTAGRIIVTGSSSVTAGDLRVEGDGMTPNSFAVLTSGNAIAPGNMTNPCFVQKSGVQSINLDGLRCAVQNTQRHGGRPVIGDGTVGISSNGWGPPNGPPGGLAAQGGFANGQTRHYQVFYRELPGTSCGREQNTSQAVTVTFTP